MTLQVESRLSDSLFLCESIGALPPGLELGQQSLPRQTGTIGDHQGVSGAYSGLSGLLGSIRALPRPPVPFPPPELADVYGWAMVKTPSQRIILGAI